jgi:hypothetical protein
MQTLTLSANNFRLNARIKVVNSWLPDTLRGKTARIVGFQTNGSTTYAKVKWCKAEYAELVGNLFPLDELKEV